MPIVMRGNKSIVVCINHEHPSHKGKIAQSMEMEPKPQALMTLEPPLHSGELPRLIRNRGYMVRCYFCKTCGYVELYDLAVIDPTLWRKDES